ncbi:MAG: hypothetical protein AAGA78_04625, partial [Pseudomonadota bacterium]
MAASDDLDGDLAKSPLPFEPAMNCARDDLTWRVALPEGRVPLGSGAYPHMIQWDAGVTPPGQALQDTGLSTASFDAVATAGTVEALAQVGAAPLFDRLEVGAATEMTLTLTRADGGKAVFTSTHS